MIITGRDGTYQLLDSFIEGGFARVYQAQVTDGLRAGQYVAIKILKHPTTNSKDEALRYHEQETRLDREARVLLDLQDTTPFIVNIIESGQNDGMSFIVMELIRGNTVHHMYDRQVPQNAHEERKRCIEALSIIMQAALGLDALHESGRVHRDLKPLNIMVTKKGLVKIIDFGLASSGTRMANMTRVFDNLRGQGPGVRGTPMYMAPEQLLASQGQEGPATDLYSLGHILWFMVAGKPLFRLHCDSLIGNRLTIEEEDGWWRQCFGVERGQLWNSYSFAAENDQLQQALNTILEKLLHQDDRARCNSAIEVVWMCEQVLATLTSQRAPEALREALKSEKVQSLFKQLNGLTQQIGQMDPYDVRRSTAELRADPSITMHEVDGIKIVEDDDPESFRDWKWPTVVVVLLLSMIAGFVGTPIYRQMVRKRVMPAQRAVAVKRTPQFLTKVLHTEGINNDHTKVSTTQMIVIKGKEVKTYKLTISGEAVEKTAGLKCKRHPRRSWPALIGATGSQYAGAWKNGSTVTVRLFRISKKWGWCRASPGEEVGQFELEGGSITSILHLGGILFVTVRSGDTIKAFACSSVQGCTERTNSAWKRQRNWGSDKIEVWKSAVTIRTKSGSRTKILRRRHFDGSKIPIMLGKLVEWKVLRATATSAILYFNTRSDGTTNINIFKISRLSR